MPPALIIIDLQNDFVSPDGLLKKSHIPLEPILNNLRPICQLFHDQGWPIISIRSEYGRASPDHGDALEEVSNFTSTHLSHLSGTHTGKRPFCVPGSKGANFHPEFEALLSTVSHRVITKSQYSAFTNTALEQILTPQLTSPSDASPSNLLGTPLYFAGVTANNCVLASLISAFRAGYQCFALSDCLGATSPNLLAASLAVIEKYYGSVLPSAFATVSTISAAAHTSRRILYYVNGSIPSWRVMMALHLKGITYTRKRLHVMTTPKETRTAEFLGINPRGKTPTLIEPDGNILIESMAILEYLHADDESRRGIPNNPTARKAWILENQRFHETENIHNVFEDIELLYKESCDEPHTRKRIYDAYVATTTELRIWERYLEHSTFIAGEEFGLADCAFFPCLAYLVHRGFDLQKEDEGFSRLKAYYERVDALPCAKDARPKGYDKLGKSLFEKVHEIADELKEGEADELPVSFFEAKMRRA
jgi:glutathione S-transferase/nicotinamidase-related amidase